MKVIGCWAVHEWDGGDRHVFAYRISKAAVTEAQIKERYPHALVRSEMVVVFESFEEVEADTKAALLRSAWSKLNALERAALCLTEEPK